MKLFSFSKTYDGTTVLDFPGYTLEPGKIYAVIGANGSGKSTFAKILANTLSADRKGIRTDAADVGYLPQKHYAFRMSARKNLLLNGSEPARADRLMEALDISHLANKRADRLSGGETARMALARLMMRSYDLVLLDEPTAAMDMKSTMLAERQIRRYAEETGCALILVTHSLQQARRIADEALFFCEGNLLEAGPVSQVLYAPLRPETETFLQFYGQ